MSGIAQYGAALDALYQNFTTAFEDGLSGLQGKFNKPWWGGVAMEVPSMTDTEVHTWIQQVPGVREWAGDRVFNAISEVGYALRNRDFEDTVQVDRNRLDDRKVGAEVPLMRALGYAFSKFPDRAIAEELLVGYASRTCYDGLTFFNDAHPVDVAYVDRLRALEPDAALGNGGLGRLAACFMESLASLDIPAYGYGIRYLNGMFRQRIDDGWQVELPETWLAHGNPWEFDRRESAYRVGFGGEVVAGTGH